MLVTYCPLEFSISRAQEADITSADMMLPLSFESAHLSFSELWLALAHSSLGGAGGKGRVDSLADGPKAPMPRAFTA